MKIRVVRRGLGSLLAAVLVGGVAVNVGAAVSAGSGWTRVASPNSKTKETYLQDVAALSASKAWAVGYLFPSGGGSTTSRILRWNGSGWAVQAHPSPPGATEEDLQGVNASSPSDAWAVGQYATTGPESTLILHWNGRGWKVVPSPNRGTGDNVLSEVAAAPPPTRGPWAPFTT